MLRGDESERDEAFVRKLCESKGIELYTEKIDINSVSAKQKIHRALSPRRDMSFSGARKTLGADITATAHNADDNLETVLFNLVRGPGLRAFAESAEARRYYKASIRIADEIDEYIRDNGIGLSRIPRTWICFARNRIRNPVIPVLKTINPGAVSNTLRMTGVLRDEEEYLEDLADMHIGVRNIRRVCGCTDKRIEKASSRD